MLGLEGLRLIFSIRTRGSSDTLENTAGPVTTELCGP